jgi:hypothetical protein
MNAVSIGFEYDVSTIVEIRAVRDPACLILLGKLFHNTACTTIAKAIFKIIGAW